MLQSASEHAILVFKIFLKISGEGVHPLGACGTHSHTPSLEVWLWACTFSIHETHGQMSFVKLLTLVNECVVS